MASLFKHRRSTLERIDKYISPIYFTDVNLYGKVYPKSEQITNITHYAAPDRVSFSEVKDQLFQETQVGKSFGPTWATHWFKLNISIPSDWTGNEIHLRWNSSSEAMIYDSSGNPIQGLSASHADKCHYPLCASHSEETKNIILYVEMACNTLFGAGKDTMIGPPDPNKYFQLQQADIAIYDSKAHDLLIDLHILHDLSVHLPEDNPRANFALYAANEMINILTTDSTEVGFEAAKKVSDKFFEEEALESEHTIHAIGHCHIDTAWLWPYAETIRKCARSWASVIQLMKKYPNFTFACSQAQQFQWIKEKYPSLFSQIKEYVDKGQFILAGGTWVEMDGNIPNGESFIRQFLYGQKFFKENFDITCDELWLPDTFGYSAQLPQIMNVCGIKRFLTQKISWNLINKFPHNNFVWQGIDGSSVVVHFPPADSYEAQILVQEVMKSVTNLMDKGRVNHGMLLFGHGDGGGGPTELMLKRQKRLENSSCCPKVKSSTPNKFFPEIEADKDKLCRWVGELYLELHNGTYTTHHRIKQQNRQSEYSLRDAEFLATICLSMSNNSQNYAAEDLEEAWKLVLLNQFHDVIPGTSIGMVYDDAHRYYAKALAIAAQVSQQSLQALFGQADERTLVCNTLSWDRIALIPIENIMLNNLSRNNSGVHYQDLSSGKKLIPVNVPSMGYSLVTELQPIKHCVIAEKLPSGLFHLKNEFVEVLLDSVGRITSLKAVDNEMEVIPSGCYGNQFVTFSDIPLYWDAWDVMDYHLETRQTVTKVVEEVRLIETGPLRATISVKLQISSESFIEQKISVDVVHPYVTIQTSIAWHETHKFLKVELPVNIHNDKASYDIQFGHLQRPTHSNTSWDSAQYEVCGHKWADLSEHDWGVAILNDSCYGHSVHGNVMRMSLLRSPKSPDANADMGNHDFTYGIFPHKGTLQAARVIQHAYELNIPVKMLSAATKLTNEDNTAASPPEPLLTPTFQHSWFTVTNPAIIIETIKKAEKVPNGLIIRLFETYGSHASTEIKTSLPLKNVEQVNALEVQKPPRKDVDYKDQCINLSFKPFEIQTILATM